MIEDKVMNFMFAIVFTVIFLGLLVNLPRSWLNPFLVMFLFFVAIFVFIKYVIG